MKFDKNKVKLKIAISKIKEENDIVMKSKTKSIFRTIVTTITGIILSTGVVFAGTIIYEKIWKEPTRINATDNEITNEILAKNIPEEEAKKIAKNKLIAVGFKNEEIKETDHYRVSGTERVNYRFLTNNWEITIDGKTGEFYDLIATTYDKSVEKYTMTKNEAIEIGKEYYKKLGYQKGEYEFVEIVPLWDNGGNYSARFYKKYGDLYNVGESIWIDFYAKDHKLHSYRVENHKCDDNPIQLTKEEAIQIAINEDRKIENKPIIKTTSELKIKAINGNAYARLHNTEEYYKPLLKTDVKAEERVTYKTEERIRKVWVVVIEYGDENANIVEKVAKGQYSYYVDATTGEIIGGSTSDELRWENYWLEQNKVKNLEK